MSSKNLVLRTVYIDPDIDDQLRNEAFAGRTSKNDLFRKYLSLGMKAAVSAADARTGAKAGVAKASVENRAGASKLGTSAPTAKTRAKTTTPLAKAG